MFDSDLDEYGFKDASGNYDSDPAHNLSLNGFMLGDKALSEQNGSITTQTTDILISLFDEFGLVMVSLDENPVSRKRYLKYINGMKTHVLKMLSE